jgi:ADP-heptose:LPS heptosyltransferase
MKPALNPNEPGALLPSLPQGAKVLVIRLRSLGDVVLTTPALAALHAWRPDLQISVVVEPAWVPVLQGNPAVAEIILATGTLSTAWELHRRRYPVVFNQHAGPASALMVGVSRIPVRVCWSGRQFSLVYNVLVPDAREFFGDRPIHTAEHRATQFYWTGMPRGPLPGAQVFPQAEAIASMAKQIRDRGIDAHTRYAILQPGARYFTKRWAVDQFAALADWLRSARGLEPFVILGPGEEEVGALVRQQMGAHATVFDSLSLPDLIALVAGAQLYVGNDAGPMHLAAALRRPVVAIFGSSSSVHWHPWETPSRVAQNDFPCNPCPGDRCYAFDEPRCILSVSVEQVRRACQELLGSAGNN